MPLPGPRQRVGKAWPLLVHPRRDIRQRLLTRKGMQRRLRPRIEQLRGHETHEAMPFGTPRPGDSGQEQAEHP